MTNSLNLNRNQLLADKNASEAFFLKWQKTFKDLQVKFKKNHSLLIAPPHLSPETFENLINVSYNAIDTVFDSLAVDFSQDCWQEKMDTFIYFINNWAEPIVLEMNLVYSQEDINHKMTLSENEAKFIVQKLEEEIRTAFGQSNILH